MVISSVLESAHPIAVGNAGQLVLPQSVTVSCGGCADASIRISLVPSGGGSSVDSLVRKASIAIDVALGAGGSSPLQAEAIKSTHRSATMRMVEGLFAILRTHPLDGAADVQILACAQ